MIGVQTAIADDRTAALRRGYALLEAAQDRDVSGDVDALLHQAQRAGWADVRLLAYFARSLAARELGQDDTEHLRAMLEAAHSCGDPALLALALTAGAIRMTDARRIRSPGEPEADPLVQAVVLLDRTDSLLVHRVAAHIEVAAAFQGLGLWPLAMEQYRLLDTFYADEQDGSWADVLRIQRRVVDSNGLDAAMDEACARAEVGDWEGARDISHRALPGTLAVLDEDWPGTWVAMIHAFADLFAGLAEEPSPADRDFVVSQARELRTDANLAMLAVADAVRAHKAGDPARAARLAEPCQAAIGRSLPMHTRLLALSLAAHAPRTPPAALAYARELVTLQWNSQLSRLGAMRASINAERRRVEHEQLREQVLVDELTGLGNRRAYTAYLERIRRWAVGAADGVVEAWTGPGLLAPQTPDLVVMMLDVDHFKAVNDTYGHDVGDEVLRRIGGLISAQIRRADLAARLGGDEFVVIMAQDADGVGEARAQSIVDAVRGYSWDDVAPGLAISISLGLHCGPVSDLTRLPAEADRQLYVAKRGGRGRMAGGTG